NGEAELSGHPGKEVEEGGEGLRLGTQRKRPRVVREVVDHHQIVLVAREAEYRGGPQVIVNEVECMRRMRRRGKRKSNMTTELARMAEGLSRSPSTKNIGTTTEPSKNVAARVTKTAVPGGGRRRRGKSGRPRRPGRRRRREWCSGRMKMKGVKGPRAVTPEERTPGGRILYSEARRVKFDGTRIVSSKLTNGKKVMNHLRSNKDI